MNLAPLMSLKTRGRTSDLCASLEQNLIDQIGLCDRWCRKTLDSIHDHRVTEYLEEFLTGRALTDIGMPFVNKVYPAQFFDRREASLLSQFLSNHFPCGYYFNRFNISDGPHLCSCGEFLDDDRDHLILTCPFFEALRGQLCDSLSIDPSDLNWNHLLPHWKEISYFSSQVLMI